MRKWRLNFTREFLRQIWTHAGYKAACFGTLGVQAPSGYRELSHTTPDAVALHKTLSELNREGVTHAAMEASSHGLDQYRLDGVKIMASGFSNLTQDHFDYHSDAEEYFQAKARLFMELTPKSAPVVINVNDEYGQQLVAMCRKRGQDVMQVGWSGQDIRIDEVMPRASSQIVDIDKGVEALERLTGVAGRMERAGRTKEGAPIFVDFAHTEDGLDKLLRSVRPHTIGKIILAFGCGGDRDPDKRPKMGAVAAKLADDIIVTDDNPRTEDAAFIRKAVLAGCPSAVEIGDRATAIREGIKKLTANDCLVIAGKGHEQGQIVGSKVIPFSDVEQVRMALKELGHV